jgi:uncharacterized protein YjiS (DUF1127 family)
MTSDIARRTSLFTERSRSIGPSSSIAALARGARRIVVALKHRRELALLADLDDRMLADIGLTRSDLNAARSEPLWQDPTSIAAAHPDRIREWVMSHRTMY